MRILIDLQAAQTPGSRHRGIGRYALSLVSAMLRLDTPHEFFIALNRGFSDSIEPLIAQLGQAVPRTQFVLWDSLEGIEAINEAHATRRQLAIHLRDIAFTRVRADCILTTSLFEGLSDDAVTHIDGGDTRACQVVILYDLIPLIHRDVYLTNSTIRQWYEAKLFELQRADLLLAISKSSRQEALQYLKMPSDRVVAISGDVDAKFKKMILTPSEQARVRQCYGLPKPFILYTGGIDFRKNIEGLIAAYAQLPKSLREQHQLAIVCSASVADEERVQRLCKDLQLPNTSVVLTGYIPDNDLIALYNMCALFVFPSWYEGFGLPALEAMRCGAPVIASNTSSLPEVVGLSAALFDPHSPQAIAQKMEEALCDSQFRQDLIANSASQSQRFTWTQSARDALVALEQVYAKRDSVQKTIGKARLARQRLAYVSPLPPQRSGIADYSAELLPYLMPHYEITLIVSDDAALHGLEINSLPIQTVGWFLTHHTEFERVIYHVGNSRFHAHMFALMEMIPGIVVLHDFYLSGVLAHMELHAIEPHVWAKALYRSHGYGAYQARFHNPDLEAVIYQYPCSYLAFENSLGVIVHSTSSLQLAKRWYPLSDVPLNHIALLRHERARTNRQHARATLGLGANDFIVCSFGMMGPTKLNHRLLSAWLNSNLARDVHCHLIFVGDSSVGEYALSIEQQLGGAIYDDSITITGWVNTEQFRLFLSAADLAVQLRTLSRGETSSAVLDCMNYGLPTIVNAHGSMVDLNPETACMLPDLFTDNQLIEALETLWRDPAARLALGERARQWIINAHHPQRCALDYFSSIEVSYTKAPKTMANCVKAIEALNNDALAVNGRELAHAIDNNMAPPFAAAQLLLDLSAYMQGDARINLPAELEVLVHRLLTNPPVGYRVEPIYWTVKWGYCYARLATCAFLDCPSDSMVDEVIYIQPCDVLLRPVMRFVWPAQMHGDDSLWTQFGVRVIHLIIGRHHDNALLEEGAYVGPNSDSPPDWLARSDVLLGSCAAEAASLANWVLQVHPERIPPMRVDWFSATQLRYDQWLPRFDMPVPVALSFASN